MFGMKQKQLSEREQLREEAITIACDLFEKGRLHGCDETGWSDTDTIGEARNIAYMPSKHMPRLWLGGCVFELSFSQAERIDNVIAKRVLAHLKQESI